MAWSLKDAYGAYLTFVSDIAGGIQTAVHALAPRIAGGLSTYRNLDVQPGGYVIKSSAGQIYSGRIFNANTSTRYLKIYDKATTPASTDTPIITLPLPGGQSIALETAGLGIVFLNGIGLRGTTGVADNDTGAPTANDVVANFFYF